MTTLAASTTHVVYVSHEYGFGFDEFDSHEEAEEFAEDFGGTVATADEFKDMTEEPEYEPEDFGVRPGIDYPATLRRPTARLTF